MIFIQNPDLNSSLTYTPEELDSGRSNSLFVEEEHIRESLKKG